MKPLRIAIVGGGTAGWLAANHLAVELKAEPGIEITVIESPEIGIIGVGEGTVPHIKKTLQKFGIPEADMLAACDTSLKNGIRFANWMQPSRKGKTHVYYHPFSSPFPAGYDVTPYYLKYRAELSFGAVSHAPDISELGFSPKRISSVPFEGVVDYAYHFNAYKFGQLLAKNATQRFSVRRKEATICTVTRNEQGNVEALQTKEGESLAYDFFVDCSGFHALLLGNTYQVPFVDISDRLLTDTALAIQVPIKNNQPIPPYTQASAHGAGWIWDIPLTTRRGVGFVYASQCLSENDAIAGLAAYLGELPENMAPRKITMKMGYREKFWVNNVVALGLAGGFVEPLEATSILVTDFAAELFARNLPRDLSALPAVTSYCNKVMAYTWERVIDFIQLHYCISDRRDTEFWIANTHSGNLSEVLAERLAIWRVHSPKKADFFSRFDLFDVDNYLYVLYGMEYPTSPKSMTAYEEQVYREALLGVRHHSDELARQLVGHRAWLDGFSQAYKQKAI